MDLLPCQNDMLRSLRVEADWRIYRCEMAEEICAVSGQGPDLAMLCLVCDECDKRPDRT